MHNRSRFCSVAFAVLSVLAVALGSAKAQEIKTEVLVPTGSRGAAVILLSSGSGPAVHMPFAKLLGAAGYYVVVADGRDFLVPLGAGDLRGANGAAELKRVIATTQTAPQALSGKVAVVGFALGGAASLKHAAPADESVAAVVAFYPNLKPLGSDIKGLAAQFKTPILVLLGEKDTICCFAGSTQELLNAPKAVPFEVGSYPTAGHAFDIASSPGYVSADASDAVNRALQFLNRVHPPRGK